MKGSIRFLIGLLMVFGAVGGLEANPDAAIGTVLLWTATGLGMMLWGVRALQESR